MSHDPPTPQLVQRFLNGGEIQKPNEMFFVFFIVGVIKLLANLS